MRSYADLSGTSGVVAYELLRDGIVVQFTDGWKYAYTRASTGAARIATMRRLAAAGRGLSGYIATTVRDAYARRFR